MQDSSGSTQNSPAGYRRHRRLVRLGQFLMVSGAVMIIIHWIAHLAPPAKAPASRWTSTSATRPADS